MLLRGLELKSSKLKKYLIVLLLLPLLSSCSGKDNKKDLANNVSANQKVSRADVAAVPPGKTSQRKEAADTPNNAEAYVNIGSMHFEQGDIEQAVKAYMAALKISPFDKIALRNLGIAYSRLERYPVAISYFRRAIEVDPNDFESQYQLGLSYVAQGLNQRAIQQLRKAANLSSRSAEPILSLGHLYIKLGSPDEALQQWQQAAPILRSPRLYSSIGIMYLDKSMLVEAEKAFRSALKINPSHSEAYNGLASIALRKGDLSLAMEQWRKALQSDQTMRGSLRGKDSGSNDFIHLTAHRRAPQWDENVVIGVNPLLSQGFEQRAEKQLEQGNIKEARQILKSSLELSPSASAHNNLGYIAGLENRTAAAIEHYKKAIELEDEFLTARYNLGLAYLKQGMPVLAAQEFQNILNIEASDHEARINLGYAFAKGGNLSRAHSEWQEVVRTNPNSSVARNNIGVYLFSNDRFNEAAEQYKSAVRAAPSFSEAHNNLAATYLKLGQTQAAISSYELAVKYNPADFESQKNLGHLYLIRDNPAKAVEHLSIALAMQPSDLDSHFNLAAAHHMLGNNKEALVLYEAFLKSAYDIPQRIEAVSKAERAVTELKYLTQ